MNKRERESVCVFRLLNYAICKFFEILKINLNKAKQLFHSNSTQTLASKHTYIYI